MVIHFKMVITILIWRILMSHHFNMVITISKWGLIIYVHPFQNGDHHFETRPHTTMGMPVPIWGHAQSLTHISLGMFPIWDMGYQSPNWNGIQIGDPIPKRESSYRFGQFLDKISIWGVTFSERRSFQNGDQHIWKNFRAGQPYYEYLLVYFDDVLVVSHAPEEIMKSIGKQFEIKNGEYGPPTIYLGAGISQVQLDHGSMCWSMESQKYVKAAIDTIKALLLEDGQELKSGQGG